MAPRRAQSSRCRIAGPALTAVLVAFSIAGLGALHLWAGEPRGGAGADVLAVALLRADVDREPDDAAARVRLARQQLSAGLQQEAEHTLAPLLRGDTELSRETADLSLEIAVSAWRALRPGTGARRAAAATAIARMEKLLAREADVPVLVDLARLANELGRPDLAASAAERAATLEPDSARAMSLGLAAVEAWRSADQGAQALRVAEVVAARFPSERAVLETAVTVALAQNDPVRARRFGEQLMAVGALDPVSLARQLDLDLAAGNVAGAHRTAQLLVDRTPDDPRSHLTAAKIATWAGQPDDALREWIWLARHGHSSAAADEAIALARALRDDAALAELLTLRSRRAPLAAPALAELSHALESTARPRDVLAALDRYARSRPSDALAWMGLAAAQERQRDLPAALATRVEIQRRFGPSLAGATAVAKLRWAMGNPAQALADLQSWCETARPDDADFWALLAELAWHEEANALALRAYGVLWDSGRIDPAGAERLMQLTQATGAPDRLIRLGRQAWSRLRQPRFLVLAMDEAARTDRWDDVEGMARETARSLDEFDGVPAYWMLRARLDERRGRIREAIGAYERALHADPKSAAARAGILWLLAGAHERETLSRYLAAWEAEAKADPTLSPAYVAGLEELGAPVSVPAGRPFAASIGTEVGAESVGAAVLARQRGHARTEFRGGEAEVRQGFFAFLSGDGGLRAPGPESTVSAHVFLDGLGGRTEVMAGGSFRRDRNLLQAGVARTQIFPSIGEARLEAAFQEAADESLALRAEGVRNRVGGAVAVREGSLYQRVAYGWKAWSTRAGEGLGSGSAVNVEIGWRPQSADAVVRLQGGYQRNSLTRAPLPAVLGGFAADRSAILPGELGAMGIGAGFGRLSLGPARLAADAWVGWIGPPARTAFRVQTGLSISPFQHGELAVSAFAANDRLTSGGNLGVTVSLNHRLGL